MLVFLINCDNNSNVRYYQLEKINITSTNNEREVNSNSLEFSVPNGWVFSEGSSMRLESFNVPFDGGFGDLSVIRLGGNAGGDLANVNRWREQLNLPVIDEIKMNEITNISKGYSFNYKWFKIINNAVPTSAFLCAILPETTTTIFVKLNVPISAINEVEVQFLEFCSSIVISK